MKHLHHFGLTDDPFRNEPRLEFFFESQQHQDALRRIERGVRQHKGLSLLIGAPGCGKTMVVRQLHERLEEEVFESIVMVVLKEEADATWMLTRLAAQLGVEDAGGERDSLLAMVYEKLAIIREDGRHTVLIIDDAQGLASRRTLTEVCGLLKLEYEDRPLLSLVLAGVPALEEALSSDPILARRADVKVRIAGLDPQSSTFYLAHRIQLAGGNSVILDSSAVKALHEYGGGLPGVMNTLADNALFEAFLCGRSQVTGTDVERVFADLGWGQSASAKSAGSASGAAMPLGVIGQTAYPDYNEVLDSGATLPMPSHTPRPQNVMGGFVVVDQEEDEDLVVELLND